MTRIAPIPTASKLFRSILALPPAQTYTVGYEAAVHVGRNVCLTGASLRKRQLGAPRALRWNHPGLISRSDVQLSNLAMDVIWLSSRGAPGLRRAHRADGCEAWAAC